MKTIKSLILPVIGTFILLLIGLYNGYPLVYSDTGTYIYSGFDKFIPLDRPITYGLFVKFFSFKYSLWFVIIIQNFITAYVLYKILEVINIGNRIFAFVYLFVLTFLMLFTGIGWYSNQIMPDFFAPITILTIFILLKDRNLSWIASLFLCLILVYSMISHFSHMLIGSALIAIILVLKLLFTQRFKEINIKRIVAIFIVVFSAWIVLPGINYLAEGKFIYSKGSHVFLISHLDDTGILEKFLKENCSKDEFKDCKLCHYKDSLPADLASFIWAGKVFENTGGWLNSKEEYNKIIKATLKSPKYLFLNIYKSFTYGLIQLTKNEIGQGLSPYIQGSAPYGQIHWRFHDELNNYLNSRQNLYNGAGLKMNSLNLVQLFILMVSLFILIYLCTTSILLKLDSNTTTFLAYIILAIMVNSFLTAGLNAACERFQARVVWMLPFALIILFLKDFDLIKKNGWFRGNNILTK